MNVIRCFSFSVSVSVSIRLDALIVRCVCVCLFVHVLMISCLLDTYLDFVAFFSLRIYMAYIRRSKMSTHWYFFAVSLNFIVAHSFVRFLLFWINECVLCARWLSRRGEKINRHQQVWGRKTTRERCREARRTNITENNARTMHVAPNREAVDWIHFRALAFSKFVLFSSSAQEHKMFSLVRSAFNPPRQSLTVILMIDCVQVFCATRNLIWFE